MNNFYDELWTYLQLPSVIVDWTYLSLYTELRTYLLELH